MEDQDRDHISSRSHFSGRSDQELDEMLDELRAGKIGINQPGQNSSEHDSEDTPEENDNASGTGNAEKSKKGKSRKEGFNLRDEVISWIQVLVAAAIIAFCVNHFIIANSEVPTSSMETTIMAGDRVIGSRLSYKFGDPQRGDIAIFIYPDDEAKGIKTYYVKRIIGMPGDTIDIVDGKVYLNGSDTPLDEPYLHEPMEPEEPQHYEVPDGCYFMLGDNRNYSNDARRWTHKYVKRDKLVAKVLFQYFPKIQKPIFTLGRNKEHHEESSKVWRKFPRQRKTVQKSRRYYPC